MSTFVPTDEQLAIIDAAKRGENLMISAYAGTGKTTTLTLMANNISIKPSLALAFNKKIKLELEKRLPSHFECKTLNGLGHVAFGRTIGRRCEVDEKKLTKLLRHLVQAERLGRDMHGDRFVNTITMVKKARQAGLIHRSFAQQYHGLLPDSPESWEDLANEAYLDPSEVELYLAPALLQLSTKEAFSGMLDYDDQIYMSAMFGGAFPKYPRVLVDESQDLSPLNHRMLSKCAVDQLCAVGDQRQAIYAFRGADGRSMENLRALRPQWTDLSLTLTYRCPRAVVARQQDHAPGYRAAPEAPEGEVLDLRGSPFVLPDGPVAILCRNNAPIIGAAFKLLRRGVGCAVMGREVGKGLVKLAGDLLEPTDSPDVAVEKVTIWMEKEARLARASERDQKAVMIEDKGSCLIMALSEADSVGDAVQKLTEMFSKENLRVTLATGHKAKGLEWPTVVHLDSFRIPSKWAAAAAQQGNPIPVEQDLNLRYVIETRAQQRLIFADYDDFNHHGED